jgi:hypothetical protein
MFGLTIEANSLSELQIRPASPSDSRQHTNARDLLHFVGHFRSSHFVPSESPAACTEILLDVSLDNAGVPEGADLAWRSTLSRNARAGSNHGILERNVRGLSAASPFCKNAFGTHTMQMSNSILTTSLSCRRLGLRGARTGLPSNVGRDRCGDRSNLCPANLARKRKYPLSAHLEPNMLASEYAKQRGSKGTGTCCLAFVSAGMRCVRNCRKDAYGSEACGQMAARLEPYSDRGRRCRCRVDPSLD